MEPEKLHFRNIEVRRVHRKVLLISFLEDREVTAEDVHEIISSCKKLAGNQPYHSVVDISGQNLSITDEGRKFYKEYSEKKSIKLSQSVVMDTLGKSLMVGAVLKIINYLTPHNFFRTRDEACEWIKRIDPEVRDTLKISA